MLFLNMLRRPAAKAKALGLEVREMRQVWLRPPKNVWRHLRELQWTTVQDIESFLFLLVLLKAMYGLVDGPLMFQLAFAYFLRATLHFVASMHDDNFMMLFDSWRKLLMAQDGARHRSMLTSRCTCT